MLHQVEGVPVRIPLKSGPGTAFPRRRTLPFVAASSSSPHRCGFRLLRELAFGWDADLPTALRAESSFSGQERLDVQSPLAVRTDESNSHGDGNLLGKGLGCYILGVAARERTIAEGFHADLSSIIGLARREGSPAPAADRPDPPVWAAARMAFDDADLLASSTRDGYTNGSGGRTGGRRGMPTDRRVGAAACQTEESHGKDLISWLSWTMQPIAWWKSRSSET